MTPDLAGAWLEKELGGRKNTTRQLFERAMDAIVKGDTVCLSREQYRLLTKHTALWKAQRIIRDSKKKQIETSND